MKESSSQHLSVQIVFEERNAFADERRLGLVLRGRLGSADARLDQLAAAHDRELLAALHVRLCMHTQVAKQQEQLAAHKNARENEPVVTSRISGTKRRPQTRQGTRFMRNGAERFE